MDEKNTVKRAFELAKSGTYSSVEQIRQRLTEEGCGNVRAHLSGPLIRKQLLATIKDAV